jgi:hypothetical protein
VLSIWAVAVIVLDDLIEELVESLVRVVGSSVNTDSGVLILDTRKDAGLERDTRSAGLVLVLVPDFLTHALFQLGVVGAGEESIEILEFIG